MKKSHRFLSFLLALALIATCLPAIPLTAQAATAQTSGYYTYTIENGEAVIIDCDTSISGDVVIPTTLGGYPVTTIGEDAIRFCENIKSITIPSSIKTIRAYAICHLSSLESVTFVSGRVTIENYAFNYLSSLKTLRFGSCEATIGEWSFSYNDLLTTVDFGTGFVYLNNNAFFLCPKITSVSFPDCGAYVGTGVFADSLDLSYTTYQNCKYLGNDNNPYVVLMKNTDYERSSLLIHQNTKAIAGDACHAYNLESFLLPGGLVSIGEKAFSSCYRPTSVTIGWQVKFIGEDAFEKQVKFSVADDNTTYCSDSAGVLYTEGKTTLIQAPDSLTGTYTLPAATTNVEVSAFRDCENLSAFAVAAGNTAFSADSQGLLYNRDQTYLVCVPAGISGGVIIPDSVTDYVEQPFYNCQKLNSVTFGKGITALNSHFFNRCDQLTQLYLHENITTISDQVFSGCGRLEYNLYNNGKYLGSRENPYLLLTKAASTDITSCQVHQDTKMIYHAAFRDSDQLTAVALPTGLQTIGDLAFANCTALTEITIPAGVTVQTSYYDSNVFSGCTGLKTATLPQDVDRQLVHSLHYLNLADIYYDGTIAQWENLTYTGGPSKIVFENAVIHTSDGIIAPGIVKGGAWGGTHTWTLSSKGVLTISGNGPLYPATIDRDIQDATNKIILSEGITAINDASFVGFRNLEEISFPSTTTLISETAISDYRILTDVYYNGTKAQWNALWATQTSPYQNCTIHLTDDTLSPGSGYTGVIGDNIRWTLDAAGTLTFSGTGTITSTLELNEIWRNAKRILIEEGITSISSSAFADCQQVTEVSLPSTLTAIGGSAFHSTGITEITIPHGITELGMGTFANCTNLTTVYLPTSITRLVEAFWGCTALTDVYYAGTHAQWSAIWFGHTNDFQNATVHMNDYTLNPGTAMSGMIGDNITWILDESGTLTLSGTGAMNGYGAGPDWSNVKKIIVGEGITTLSNGIFMSCGASEVSLPSTLTEIGSHAFSSCRALKSITLPNGLKTISDNAFGDSGLESISIPAAVSYIGMSAFMGCSNLKSVTIAGGAYLESSAFWNCKALTTVKLGKVTYIGSDTFHDCTALTTITIPSSVKTIDRAAFAGCTALANVTVQDGVEWISHQAFSNCSALKSIELPKSVTYIAENVFTGCSSLESLTVPFIGPDRDSSTRWSYPLGWFFGISEYEGSIAALQKTIEFEGIMDQVYYIPASLRSVTVTDSVLPYAAFRNCRNLTTVYLSTQISNIPNYTFDGCNNLTDVYYAGTQGQWNALSKGTYNDPLYKATIHFNDQMVPNGWYLQSGNWYFGRNGKNVTGWLLDGGKWYFMDSTGKMLTGWVQDGGKWYFMDSSGKMLTGWVRDGGSWYFMNSSGAMMTGWLQEGTTWYYLNSSGRMVTGDYMVDGELHRFNGSGVWLGRAQAQKNGWLLESGKWYYYKNNVKQKGWLQEGSTWYYLDANGAMVTGEYTIGDKLHKFNGSGVWLGEVQQETQKNGWVKEGGKWYYYRNNMKFSGWLQDGGKWYFLNGKGEMVTGWLKLGNIWYYLQPSGAMVTGWCQIGPTWYYFQSSGAMATGTVKIGSVTYHFAESGVWIP